MLIAHLPLGALVGFAHEKIRRGAHDVEGPTLPKKIWAAHLMGSVLPDVDMLLFLAQGGHTHHHDFLTHRPLFWGGLLVTATLARRWEGWSERGKMFWGVAVVVCLQALLHLVMDTFQGQIAWGWPFFDAGPPFVHVDAVAGQHWVLTFMKHPFFLLEVSLVLLCLAVWRRRNKLVLH